MSGRVAPGSVMLLATRTADGGVRSRPVTVFPGFADDEVAVLTGPGARKLDEITQCPQVSLAGPIETGWWSGEGLAWRDSDPAHVATVLAAAGVGGIPAALLRVRILSAREWTVHSADPWDNTVEEVVPPVTVLRA